MDFLKEDLEAPQERIHVQIQIHEGDNQLELENFWAKVTGVETRQFNKTIIRPVGRKIGKSKGTCKIRFVDKQTYLKLESLLQRVLTELYEDPETILQTLPHYEFVLQYVKIDK